MEIKEKLSTIIRSCIVPLIDNDYVYLELPYYSNIGDTLIWQGTEDFLKTLSHKCLYRASFSTFEYQELAPNVVILLQGGGNFGDLYYIHNAFRNKIIKLYPNNRIIILPQTIYYNSYRYVIYDSHIMRKHKNLYVCARDQYSYDFLKQYKFGKNILLVPDMAFCILDDTLKKYSMPTINKALVFKRKDKEKTDLNQITTSLHSKYDFGDWPLYEEKDERLSKMDGLIKEHKMSEADNYAQTIYLPERVQEGIRFISQYNPIYSNRLHGAILSVLLGKEVTIIDNSYGKNSQYYDTWLQGVPFIHIKRVKHNKSFKRSIKMMLAWCIVRSKLSDILLQTYLTLRK